MGCGVCTVLFGHFSLTSVLFVLFPGQGVSLSIPHFEGMACASGGKFELRAHLNVSSASSVASSFF